MARTILVVDDDPDIREAVVECLTDAGYACVEAGGVAKALDILRRDSEIFIAVVDINMPGKSGLTLIADIRAERGNECDLEFIVMTGDGKGSQDVIRAMRLGAIDFLEKPVDVRHLIHVVQRTGELLSLKRAHRHLEKSMEETVQAKTFEARRLVQELELAYEESLDALAEAAEYKDPETGNHIRRIGAYAGVMASALGWTKDRTRIIELAAPLHDVGKIGTPDAILLKPGKLTAEEFEVMKQHARMGSEILSRSDYPVMRYASTIAWGHHERWDGSGYPRGLRGDENPIEARITTLGDVYDALRSVRPYKPSFDHEQVLSIILKGDGRTAPSHFDPELLEMFRNKASKFEAIFNQLAD